MPSCWTCRIRTCAQLHAALIDAMAHGAANDREALLAAIERGRPSASAGSARWR